MSYIIILLSYDRNHNLIVLVPSLEVILFRSYTAPVTTYICLRYNSSIRKTNEYIIEDLWSLPTIIRWHIGQSIMTYSHTTYSMYVKLLFLVQTITWRMHFQMTYLYIWKSPNVWLEYVIWTFLSFLPAALRRIIISILLSLCHIWIYDKEELHRSEMTIISIIPLRGTYEIVFILFNIDQ